MRKNLLLITLLSFLLFFLITSQALALCDESDEGKLGLVPCGIAPIRYDNQGNLLTGCPCGLGHLFLLIHNIIRFFLFKVIPYVAVLMIIIGGVVFLFSGGNPTLKSLGKNILITAVAGIFIAYFAYLIIKAILEALGYIGTLPSI